MPSNLPVHPWIDTRQAPLFIITAPARFTDSELRALLTALETWYETLDYPIAYVIDTTPIQAVSSTQRTMLSEMERRTRFTDFRWNRGQAFVVKSALMRGVISIVWVLSSPPYPHAVFSNLQDAMAWARAGLSAKKSAAG